MWRAALRPIGWLLLGLGLAALVPAACATGSDTGAGGDGGEGGEGGGTVLPNGPGATGPASVGPGATNGPGGTNTSSGIVSSASGGGACDNTGDCVMCANCSQLGLCAPQTAACNASVDCVNYANCVDTCAPGDTLCIDDCAATYPQGGLVFDDLAVCVICGDCYNDCNGATANCP